MAGAIEIPTAFRDPLRTARWVMVSLIVFRLLYLIPFNAQFDLAGDESYYWDWGRRLDWGYFSKPPMIGWLMGAVGRMSGNSEWGIRLCALAFGSLSLVLLHQFAGRLFGPRVALVALLLAALTPANAALSLLLTIDAPLVLCWTAALHLFWSAAEKPGRRLPWVLLTLVLGLGHLSKQMMLVFLLLMILHAALNPSAHSLLRRPAFWICILGSLLFLGPMIWWNAQHDWVTLKHTGHHFETKPSHGMVRRLANLPTFVGLQALTFSPLTWLLLIAAALGGLWKWRALSVKERYLVLFSAPGLVACTLLALRQRVNPNWPAAFYIGAAILAAAWLDRAALEILPWPRLRRWLKPALFVGATSMVAGYLLPFATTLAGLAGSEEFDFVKRVRGWNEVGKRAGDFLTNAPQPGNTFVIVIGHRYYASQLAFYMPQQPRVFRYVYRDLVESQYEIWPDPGDYAFSHGDALLFLPMDKDMDEPSGTIREIPRSLRRQFREMDELGAIRVPLGRDAERSFKVYQMRNLKFWDPPLTRDVEAFEAAEKPPPIENPN